MISPELIRRYPFYCCLDDPREKALAMMTDDVSFPKGTIIFKEGDPADHLYLLMEGSVVLSITGAQPGTSLFVAEINPGEPFGISSVMGRRTLLATARAQTDCRVLRTDAAELRRLCVQDCTFGYTIMRQVADAAMERLHHTYVQLAALQP